MSDCTLYYWPLPFRGEFVRAILHLAWQSYEEPGADEIAALQGLRPSDQPVPFMAPPMLVDHRAGLALAQLPAILRYLGAKHGLLPQSPAEAALTDKIVGDTNDVLDELTLFGGRSMWTAGEWQTFITDRLPRWVAIFEQTLRDRDVTCEAGYLAGHMPQLADVTIAVLWGVMTDKLPPLRPLLEREAPAVAALSARVLALPPIATLRAQGDEKWGDLYCGGQIESSIRDMLKRHGTGMKEGEPDG